MSRYLLNHMMNGIKNEDFQIQYRMITQDIGSSATDEWLNLNLLDIASNGGP